MILVINDTRSCQLEKNYVRLNEIDHGPSIKGTCYLFIN